MPSFAYDPSLDDGPTAAAPSFAYDASLDTDTPKAPQSADVTWGDEGKNLLGGAAQVGASYAGAARAGADASRSPNLAVIAEYFQKSLQDTAEKAYGGMNDVAKERLNSAVTDPAFYEHPISASFLKAVNMTPGLAAMIVPSLLAAETGPAGSAAAGAASAAAMGAGQSANDIYDLTDKWSDKEYQTNYPFYAELRKNGVAEDDARSQANIKLMGLKPLANAIANAAGMALGPAGRVAGLIPEAVGSGILKRAAVGAGEAAAGGALMGGTEEATRQQIGIDLDQRTGLDPSQILAAAGDSAAQMGVIGALGGAAFKAHEAPDQFHPNVAQGTGDLRTGHPADLRQGIEQVDSKAPDAAQMVAMQPHTVTPTPEPAAEPVQAPVQAAPNPAENPNVSAPDNSGVVPPVDAGVLTPAEPPKTVADDAGKTVPESKDTLQAQQAQLVNNERQAMLFPKGSGRPLPVPEGMKYVTTKDGTIHYNPKALKPKDVIAASKDGRLNDILDLGPYSKEDLAPRLAAGEAPLAVTERAPDGTEVKAAAGTEGTAPEQVAHLEATKTPGNTVAIENGKQVIRDRLAAAKAAGEALRQKTDTPPPATAARVRPKRAQVAAVEPLHEPDAGLHELPASKMAEIGLKLARDEQTAQKLEAAGTPVKEGIAAFIARKREAYIAEANNEAGIGPKAEAAPRAPKTAKGEGQHFTKDEKAERAATNKGAADIIDRFAPTADEENSTGPVARELLIDRLSGMIDASKDLKLPAKLKDTTDKEMQHNAAVALLVHARELAKKKSISTADMEKFRTAEKLLRAGDRDMVLAERRAENDAKYKREAPDTEKLEAVPEESNEHSEEAEAEAPTDEPRDRPQLRLKGDEFTAGKDAAGLFRTEVKKKIVRQAPSGKVESKEMSRTEKADADFKMSRELHGKTIHEVADYLERHATNEGDAMIARQVGDTLKRLEAAGQKFSFKVVQPGDVAPASLQGGKALASTDPAKRTTDVYVKSPAFGDQSGMNHITVLHELVHAATHQGLIAGKHVGGDHASRRLYRDAINIHDAVIRAINKKIEAYTSGDLGALNDFEKQIYEGRNNALQNEYEIVAWGMTDPRMRDMLESIPYEKGNAFSGFVTAVRKFLGLPEKAYTALSEVMRISEQLMKSDTFEVSQRLDELGKRSGWTQRGDTRVSSQMREAGNFTPAGNIAHTDEINGMFHEPFKDAIVRGLNDAKDGAKSYANTLTSPAKSYAAVIAGAKSTGSVLGKVLNAVTTNGQYVEGKVGKLIPMAQSIMDSIEKVGVSANKLKEEGVDLAGAMIRAQKQNPGLFEKFAALIHEQTMVGADASQEIGVGRNRHLALSKDLEGKIAKGAKLDDVAHEAALSSWEARAAHPGLQAKYEAIKRVAPEYASLQKKLFDFYEHSQSEMARGQIGAVLDSYGFKGTDAERADAARTLHQGKLTEEQRADLASKIGDTPEAGETALDRIDATDSLKVKNGPYAPLMRRGEHAIVGEYKIEAPKNGTKIDDDHYEFKTRDAAHDFATKNGLHSDTKIVYYDTNTGKRVATKEDAISQTGEPEQRFEVKLQRQHLEFHESERDAAARIEELKKSGLFEKLGLEERRHIESENSSFSGRGVETLLRSLASQKHYQDASELEKAALRHTIREAGLRSMAENRVQSRRLPRRYVQGASDDIARNLYDYNNSQANYRAKLEHQKDTNDGLKAMWEHVKANRYSDDNQARSAAANEIERRVRAPDPNDATGAYTNWTRRLMTWSYIDRMARPSHLILHQTHLPMITAPYMAGRHGLMNSFGTTLKAWKELTGFYGAGGHDAWATTVGSALQKGADYGQLAKDAFAKAGDGKRLAQMIDTLGETGIIHPQAGIEVHKYLPSKKLGGIVGGLDNGLQKVDTIFRHMTNATEAMNRIAGATAAYRMEFSKLTRAGKGEAEAYASAVEYARKVLSDTQGLYSSTNAAPLFKNKILRPFLQFKQFPQMMYHLLSKLAVQSLKGETREAKIEAMSSLATILGMHMMMAGVLQGLPLEPFKLVGLISKSIGLTDGDWNDVEQSVTRSLNNALGKDVGTLLTRGVGAQLGVDVHHRLGLNSFVTYGMPDQLDSKSASEFILNMAGGAPYGLAKDMVQGAHQMISGDVEGGALKAFPLQALRDVHNAISPADNKYGYVPTAANRAESLLGFTPEAKAVASEKKEAVYNATHEYDAKRSELMKAWVSASPADRNDVWEKIQAWNADQPGAAKLTKGDLLKSAAAGARKGTKVDYLKTNKHNKFAADQAADLYQ